MIAGAGFGILGHYWYMFLDTKFPGKALNVILKKLGCEVLAGPIFVSLMFFAVGLMEGKTLTICGANLKANIVTVCLVSS